MVELLILGWKFSQRARRLSSLQKKETVLPYGYSIDPNFEVAAEHQPHYFLRRIYYQIASFAGPIGLSSLSLLGALTVLNVLLKIFTSFSSSLILCSTNVYYSRNMREVR